MSSSPPAWGDALLRAVLAPRDAETVSGDLLEAFREKVSSGGRRQASVWYVRQVLGFLVRGAAPWAIVFGAAVVTRTGFDWFAPPVDFHARATASTAFGISIFLIAGLIASWRTGSFTAGALNGMAIAALGAVVSTLGAAVLLAIWHDPHTMSAIQASGGVSEVFDLPVMMIVPGILLGSIGGIIGAALSRAAGRHPTANA
jgi:hypothetical protein